MEIVMCYSHLKAAFPVADPAIYTRVVDWVSLSRENFKMQLQPEQYKGKQQQKTNKKPDKNTQHTHAHTKTHIDSKMSGNPIQDRGRKGAAVNPNGSVASPEGDREPLEEMTCGFLCS